MDMNVVGWFEIPVEDMQRASTFYETVLGHKIDITDFEGIKMGMFPMVETGMGAMGALVQHEGYKPSADGTLVYFSAFSGDVANELAKVEAAGGKVLVPKKKISDEHGFMGVVLDTEGNKVAFHSRQG